MNDAPFLPEPFAQRWRYDGLVWRKFAHLGSVYGPEWLKRSSPAVVAAILFVLVGRKRRGAVVNLQRVLGLGSRRQALGPALRMFTQFAHCLTETLECYGPRPQPVRIDVAGRDALGAALSGGRGAVMVTGHVGNWDIAAKGLHEYGRPINLVMAPDPNGSAAAYARQVRDAAGVRVIYSGGSVFSSFDMLRALRRNEVVAIQLDRPLAGSPSRRLPFFGAPAPFPIGPFVLARVAGAPLIPVFIPRLGTRHYTLRVCGEFIVPPDSAALEPVMAQVVAAFESVVREFPTQWFQFAPFWTPEERAAASAQYTLS